MEGKTSKYLKYAIGEIVLVVIGILIALQINNWNERQKDKAKVKIALKSLHKDIVKDSIYIFDRLPRYIQAYEYNKLLIEKAYATSSNMDTLIKIIKEDFGIFWVGNLPNNRNSFDNLKSNGLFEILPDSIKSALSELYTMQDVAIDGIKETNIQYRTHLDEFLKTYNLIGRISNDNYKNSFIYNDSWQNINKNHFTPRVATLLGSYGVLYNTTQEYLTTVQNKIRTVLPLLKPENN
jgi:hypothetical protein